MASDILSANLHPIQIGQQIPYIYDWRLSIRYQPKREYSCRSEALYCQSHIESRGEFLNLSFDAFLLI